jgi:hypothetical protein
LENRIAPVKIVAPEELIDWRITPLVPTWPRWCPGWWHRLGVPLSAPLNVTLLVALLVKVALLVTLPAIVLLPVMAMSLTGVALRAAGTDIRETARQRDRETGRRIFMSVKN